MKRLALLLLSLFLLCGCAPQMGEEKLSFSLPTLEEERGETTEGEVVVHPLDQKILLDFDSREEFATDSVRVTLKASASDHLDPPTAEDFPGIDLSRIEYLVTGGYDMEKGKDWDTYFSAPERKPEYFRWRLRLYFENPSEQTARAAVDVLNGMKEVALVQNEKRYREEKAKEISPYEFQYRHPNNALVIVIESDFSDPNVPYVFEDFEENPALSIRSTPLVLDQKDDMVEIENGVYRKYWSSFQTAAALNRLPQYHRGSWKILFEIPPSDDNELMQYAKLLLQYDVVAKVELVHLDSAGSPAYGPFPAYY